MKKAIKAVESLSEYTGRIFSVLCIALVAVLTYESIARYAFNRPTSWGMVTASMLYGGIGMLGLAYTDLHNGHIRVDVLYNRLSVRGKAVMDMVLALVLLFPFLFVMLRISGMWMMRSITQHEVMMESFWYPVAWPFRTMVVVAFVLFILQSLARLARDIYTVVRGKRYG